MAYRQVLAVEGMTLPAVVDIQIVQLDEIVVAAGDQHTVRCLEPGQAIVADQGS